MEQQVHLRERTLHSGGSMQKNQISVETVKNSWRHGECSWFPNEEDDDSNEG